MQIEIIPTTRLTYRQAAEVLGRAFVDDPVSLLSYKGFTPERRIRALTVDFSTELQVCIRRGYPIQVNEDGKAIAAALIYPPGTHPLPVIDQWRIIISSLIGNGINAVRDYLRWYDIVNKYHPSEAHYYLEYLGVEPDYHGKGLGSTILKHLITKADLEGVGCYLENANLKNISFYQRAGFTVLREMKIAEIPTWLMWRSPIIR